MTQIVLYQSSLGVLLATDSRAVSFGEQRDRRLLTVNKLFSLSPHAVLATGGAGYGVYLCHRFMQHVRQAGLWKIGDLRARALPFFRAEMAAIQGEPIQSAATTGLDRVYFILCGYAPGEFETSLVVEVFGADRAGDQLQLISSGAVLTIPRQLTFEFRLSSMVQSGADLESVERICARFLRNLAEASDDVGAPFRCARITAGGVDLRDLREFDE